MSPGNPCEWDLIEWIGQQAQDLPASVLQHIGDDCAVFDPPAHTKLAVTADMMVEDVHFRRRWTHPYFLGRKSLSVNLSDQASVGAQPYACLLSLALPRELTGDYFRSFVSGFLKEGARWKSPLIGGDLSHSDKIVVSVTAWGCLQEGPPPWRSSAQDQDAIIVIGEIGFARLGLALLEREDPSELSRIEGERSLEQWAGDGFRYRCVKAHLLPQVLVEVGIWLCNNRLANAMIDISDGLSSDLLHIAQGSQLAAAIEIDRLPLPARGVGELSPLDATLHGGEDYALLLTASPQQLERLKASYPSHFPPYQVIGQMSQDGAGVYLKQRGRIEKYQQKGFDHFR